MCSSNVFALKIVQFVKKMWPKSAKKKKNEAGLIKSQAYMKLEM